MTAAFNNTTSNHICDNIRTLYTRRKKVGKMVLTNEEYIKTFIPYEWREHVRDITPLLAVDKPTHKWELRVRDSALNATLHMRGLYPAPALRDVRIQSDAPEEIVTRIHQWTEHGGDVSRDFGRVTKVFTLLNEKFSRVAIRYYWPTILALCSESNKTKHLVQEMQEMRQPVKLKPLPQGLPLACRQTAETIATARLIPSDIDNQEELAVTLEGSVTIGIVEGQYYTESFGTFYGA